MTDQHQTGALSTAEIRTLLAVVHLSETRPSMSVRDVMRARGLTSPSGVWEQLTVLRRCGLVDWVDGRSGTLHPTVRAVLHFAG